MLLPAPAVCAQVAACCTAALGSGVVLWTVGRKEGTLVQASEADIRCAARLLLHASLLSMVCSLCACVAALARAAA